MLCNIGKNISININIFNKIYIKSIEQNINEDRIIQIIFKKMIKI